ncbi:glycosyltransferase family 4 protein [Paucibacter sp. M5-1]|uniref:glycosyltransferase family 4 protein n=1 Tax=Paucibacter sp. M5-1 TaxID=3015998 RepID=UPI0022B93AF9|nr:glycosyltransferase family 1 protein [Paucibacter sp. M5-1]MCZ7879640.1 glycosyltransferase family 1 protein [Paucibacter sp. M5-1]
MTSSTHAMPVAVTSTPKIHVGFWFDFGLAYAGGLNYFRNLLHALHAVQPEHVRVTLFIGKDLPPKLEAEFRAIAEVVKLDILTRGTWPWFFHRIAYRGLRSQFFVERVLRQHGVDVVSHPSMVGRLSPRFRLISWIPDFQYLHLPHLFPGLDVDRRSAELRELHRHSDAVVVSSEDAHKDFAQVMGEAKPPRTHVLPFVSQLHLGPTSPQATRELLDKHGLPERFFLLPNQFWAHKNHRTAFEAVAQLKREGLDVTLACTGWIKDPNGNTLAAEALRLLDEQDLHGHVRLLGSIDYADVQGLMRASVAVLNPSFFEGWSSSVEESKSMGKALIASDIAVHREQAHPQAKYFDPKDPTALAALLRQAWAERPGGIDEAAEAAARIALHRRTLEFGQRYMQILETVAAESRPHRSISR